MLGGKPFSGARDARLHLVSDEHDAVLAADVLENVEIAARRNNETALAKDRFRDYRSDGFGGDDALEGIFQVSCKTFCRGSFFAAIGISERNPVDFARKRSKTCLVRMRL